MIRDRQTLTRPAGTLPRVQGRTMIGGPVGARGGRGSGASEAVVAAVAEVAAADPSVVQTGADCPATTRASSMPFILLAGAVVALGALLRCWRLDLAEFKGDELAVARLALALAQHGQWPARGIPSSLGTDNAPLFIYIEAIPALLRPTPLALTAFVALLNVLALAGTLWFARRYFGHVAALAGGLAFACAPWAVAYSRKIWEQDALPPLVLLFFVGLFAVVVDRKPWRLLLCGAAASLAFQLHPSAVVLPAVGLAALLVWPRRFPLTALAASLAVALALLLPYLLAEHAAGFADWQTALAGTPGARLDRPTAVALAWLFWAEANSAWQLFGMFSPDGLARGEPPVVLLADLLTWAALAAGLVALLVDARRALAAGCAARWRAGATRETPGSTPAKRPEPGAGAHHRAPPPDPTHPEGEATLLLALWLLLPPLLLGLTGMRLFPHYLIVTYPAAFLAVGRLAGRLWPHPAGRPLLLAGGALVAANVATLALFFHLAGAATLPDGYGLPLAQAEQAARAIRADAGGAAVALSVDSALRDGAEVMPQLIEWQGGAVLPPLMGTLSATGHGVALASAVPAVAYCGVALYAFFVSQPRTRVA